MEELLGLLEHRRRLYDSYNDVVNKYKSSKESAAFMNARKKIDSDYRGVSNKIAERQTALASDQAESADKVRTFLSKSSFFKDHSTKAALHYQSFCDRSWNFPSVNSEEFVRYL